MAVIHGIKGTGKAGVLTYDELKGLIHGKSNGRANEKNCGTCANYILDKTETSDGGGITTKFAGRTVYHISSGKRGGKDGCTVFFTLTEGEGPGLTAGIVGVGWHANGSDHVYDLDWGKGPPFFTGNKIDTSTQRQAGYKRDR